ncbi:SPOR domain-containing protein [Litoreibacter roseus]|nr:SPOR domain-containing protein [Litoreibacter roseus]
MGHRGARHVVLVGTALFALAGCEEFKEFTAKQADDKEATATASAAGTANVAELEQRDVEAPEVFQATDQGLWDGRPSLGGVWVAHPDVKNPERVVIRNEANGKSVVGALFRRERDNPGPVMQLSSDAAESLGVLAGQPVSLAVTALKKETVAPAAVVSTEAATTPEGIEEGADEAATGDTAAPGAIQQSSLDPLAAAEAAIEESEALAPGTPPASDAAQAAPSTAVAAAPAAAEPETKSRLLRPYVQVGLYDDRAAADATLTTLSAAGVVPVLSEEVRKDKTFWRVTVGPAMNSTERRALRKQVRDLGFKGIFYTTG